MKEPQIRIKLSEKGESEFPIISTICQTLPSVDQHMMYADDTNLVVANKKVADLIKKAEEFFSLANK